MFRSFFYVFYNAAAPLPPGNSVLFFGTFRASPTLEIFLPTPFVSINIHIIPYDVI